GGGCGWRKVAAPRVPVPLEVSTAVRGSDNRPYTGRGNLRPPTPPPGDVGDSYIGLTTRRTKRVVGREENLTAFQGGQAFAGHGGFFGAREVVDEVLQAGLRLCGLFQIDQGQRFLVQGCRHLVTPRVVREALLELLHGLLERLRCLVTLRRIAESARQREVGLADPVLGAAGQLVIGVAPQELAKARDRQRVAALAEVDVRRLID